ncbi:hypothetical protein [Nocardioides sp. GY 10127]|uniref:hypothetical protein n=1 Tax=Nocardioides sp. GY 10127 TaxID=2569762 RepID=UPI0010A8D91C|nr:hypothetical protein [Nocardioides sp. GY 10127]TIC85673.1 hypothetical protein E8D37_03425 [Nocardioides sp. GY 10127]
MSPFTRPDHPLLENLRRGSFSPWPFVGAVAHAAMLFLLLGSTPFLSWWALVPLLLLWLLGLERGYRWWTSHPLRVLAVPGVLALLWAGAVAVGA